MRLRRRPVRLLGAIRAQGGKRDDFADAVELNAYHGDKLSQTNNSCAVVFATYSADN